jgi:hypothetical protein
VYVCGCACAHTVVGSYFSGRRQLEGENLDGGSDGNELRSDVPQGQRRRRLSKEDQQQHEAAPVLPPPVGDDSKDTSTSSMRRGGIDIVGGGYSVSMQELQKEVASLREELSTVGELKAELAALRARVELLEPIYSR